MNDGLKQRIVGALVLIALGIIFIPVIFDKERIVPVDRVTQIPLEPDLRALPLPEAAEPPRPLSERLAKPIDGDFEIEDQHEVEETKSDIEEVNEVVEAVSEAVEPATIVSDSKAKTVNVEPKKTVEDLTLQSEMWVLQVASYVDTKQAQHTLSELENLGYRAFIKKVETAAGTRTRLYLGPSIDKSNLEKAKREVDKKYSVDTLLLRFKP